MKMLKILVLALVMCELLSKRNGLDCVKVCLIKGKCYTVYDLNVDSEKITFNTDSLPKIKGEDEIQPTVEDENQHTGEGKNQHIIESDSFEDIEFYSGDSDSVSVSDSDSIEEIKLHHKLQPKTAFCSSQHQLNSTGQLIFYYSEDTNHQYQFDLTGCKQQQREQIRRAICGGLKRFLKKHK
jgi:hypothetical protein